MVHLLRQTTDGESDALFVWAAEARGLYVNVATAISEKVIT